MKRKIAIFSGGRRTGRSLLSARPPWWKGRVQDEVLISQASEFWLLRSLKTRPAYSAGGARNGASNASSVSQNFDSRWGFVGKRGSKIDLVSTWLPRRLQEPPRCLQEPPRFFQELPRASELPRCFQDASRPPTWPPRASNLTLLCSKST